MRHSLILGTALCLLATAAHAGGNHSQPQPAPQPAAPSYAMTSNSGAYAGAAAQSRSASTATGGNATAQGGRGGQANNGGQSQTTNYSGGNYSARGNTPDAFAPSMNTANECALGRSFGAGVPFVGSAATGWATESDDCKRLRMMNYFARTGDVAMAREMACQTDDVMRRAAYSSGRPCARDARGWDRR